MAQTCVTEDDVMDFGNLNNDSLRPRVRLLLASVFAAVEQYCLRKFSSDTFTETFDVEGDKTSLLIANPPITGLTSVVDDHAYSHRSIDTASDVIYSTEYKDRGEIHLYMSEGYFSTGLQSVEVVYTGGYTYSTFPAELRDAICAEVLYRLNDRAIGARQVGADGAYIMMTEGRGGFTKDVADVLDKYRCWWKGFG